ncbi:autophagy-related protein 11 [Iris pallida]|uniref:Autophagy-related protein 11 n=1 Tax=Iris pallida TaxID=29817 RepID=A0AAX6EAH4_IRIPA|nr:autophagy-related protein 11 [Iris pallida]
MSSNSTITTDEFTPRRKLLVHLSENGHSFEFECDGSTPVDAIQRSVESLSGIQFGDQLLMCGKISLDPQQPLAYYKLPQDDREVFLYNKSKLLAESPRPPPETIDVPHAVVPSLPSPLRSPHPLDDASDPAMKALASYEKQFRYHFQHANAFYLCSQNKFEICKRLLREQQVQERALDTARGNLEHTFKRLHQRYSDFVRYFSQQHRIHGELLGSFERDVERLRSLRLHPEIQREGRKCLLDLVNEHELRKWADICLNSHRQFESKVSQLKMSFGDLKRRVENVFSEMTYGSVKDLEVLIRDHQRVLNDQKSVMQSLSKDVDTVKKLVDDCLSCQLSASLRPHDAVSALGPMYEAHEKNNLPKVQNCDHAITKLLDKCRGKKDGMNLLVHVSMQKVKSSQFSIKDMMNQLHAFQEVMGHQEKEFENLKFISGIGHAYRACLAEVIRRKSSLKLYMGLAGQLAERLATERETEISRRERFLKQWNRYIPDDILDAMGLFDSPSQCDVNMAPFDSKLLEIDVADVDRYAPQLGSPSKSEKNKLPKSNLATSSDGSNFKSEENPFDTHLNYDTEGLLGGCEPVDIAGTSKMEVENARLKGELASAIAIICTFNADAVYGPFDKVEPDDMLKAMREKTTEALQSKDEYVKHIQSMLHLKQVQCSSYEKRIQELEQRLGDYMQGQKNSTKNASGSVLSAMKAGGYREGIFGDGETHMPCVSTVSMDEMSSTSASADQKLDPITGQATKPGEGGDENMSDLSGTVNMQSMDSARNFMDASMQETSRDEHQVGDTDDHQDVGLDKSQAGEVKMMASNNSNIRTNALNVLPSGVAGELTMKSNTRESVVSDLQNALAHKSDQCIEGENKLKVAMEEISSLRRELEVSRNLLDESQMNCAHLENCLHEAREEARTNLCTADRRASEYSALRTTAVRMRSLFERFRSCVNAQVSVASFADALRSFSLSLASSVNDDEDDGTVEFRASIKVLADKVGLLSRHRSDLLDRCSMAETALSRAETALDEKTEQVKSLYTKHQIEKQASKEKISFVRLEVHELACFVLNSAGHYEAVHRNCSNYYLSPESVALFTEQYAGRPSYIIGQIVHIERRAVRPPAPSRAEVSDKTGVVSSEGVSNPVSPNSGSTPNPYGLPVGCEYFLVTVAMLPDAIHSVPS